MNFALTMKLHVGSDRDVNNIVIVYRWHSLTNTKIKTSTRTANLYAAHVRFRLHYNNTIVIKCLSDLITEQGPSPTSVKFFGMITKTWRILQIFSDHPATQMHHYL